MYGESSCIFLYIQKQTIIGRYVYFWFYVLLFYIDLKCLCAFPLYFMSKCYFTVSINSV